MGLTGLKIKVQAGLHPSWEGSISLPFQLLSSPAFLSSWALPPSSKQQSTVTKSHGIIPILTLRRFRGPWWWPWTPPGASRIISPMSGRRRPSYSPHHGSSHPTTFVAITYMVICMIHCEAWTPWCLETSPITYENVIPTHAVPWHPPRSTAPLRLNQSHRSCHFLCIRPVLFMPSTLLRIKLIFLPPVSPPHVKGKPCPFLHPSNLVRD